MMTRTSKTPQAKTGASARRMLSALAATMVAGLSSVVLVSGAEARCGTSKLDGLWSYIINGDSVSDVVIKNGFVVFDDGGKLPISQTRKCKVRLTNAGTVFAGSSEAIPETSGVKPRRIYVGNAQTDGWFTLIRHSN
jgi:hypothetical protein